MTIRKNVEFILKAKFMNKAQLAELLNIAPSSVTQFLDSDNIGLQNIVKIAKALQVRPADIVAYPYLSMKRPYSEGDFIEKPKKEVKATVNCPTCGTSLKITITEA